MARIATAASNQIVDVHANLALSLIPTRSADDTVSPFTGVVRDDRVHKIQMTPDIDPSALAKGAIIADGAVDESQHTVIVDSTGTIDRFVAADGAVGEHRCAIAGDVNTAATAHRAERIGVLGLVTANGAIYERQRASFTLDPTSVATSVTNGPDSIGEVVADGAIGEHQRTSTANAAATVRTVVTDDTTMECQCTEIHDGAATLLLSTRLAMPNHHFLKNENGLFFDEKDSFRSLAWHFVALHNGIGGTQSSDGDVVVDDNAGFSVDGIGHLDDGAAGDAIEGSLDGGKVAAGGAHGIRCRQRRRRRWYGGRGSGRRHRGRG